LYSNHTSTWLIASDLPLATTPEIVELYVPLAFATLSTLAVAVGSPVHCGNAVVGELVVAGCSVVVVGGNLAIVEVGTGVVGIVVGAVVVVVGEVLLELPATFGAAAGRPCEPHAETNRERAATAVTAITRERGSFHIAHSLLNRSLR
jgi:hypothetical protein